MLTVGLIGLGRDWGLRHRSALQTLAQRLHVSTVWAPVQSRAAQAAKELNADVAGSLYSMFERPDIDAVLLLEVGWFCEAVLRWSVHHEKPVYLSRTSGDCLETCATWLNMGPERGDLLMPEFPMRYMAATSRLRELVAVKLGRPEKVEVEAIVPADSLTPRAPGLDWASHEPIADVLDWCCSLVGGVPDAIETRRFSATADSTRDSTFADCQIRLEFDKSGHSSRPCVADIRFVGRPATTGCSPETASVAGTVSNPALQRQPTVSLRGTIECVSGRAVLETPDRVTWSQGTQSEAEHLETDRTETEVLLDHFCRRVAGGLIAVPTVDDVRRTWKLVRAVLHSSETGARFRWSDADGSDPAAAGHHP